MGTGTVLEDVSRSYGCVPRIIPHLNDYENLGVCLILLGKQTFPRERTEIIIADNGSKGCDPN